MVQFKFIFWECWTQLFCPHCASTSVESPDANKVKLFLTKGLQKKSLSIQCYPFMIPRLLDVNNEREDWGWTEIWINLIINLSGIYSVCVCSLDSRMVCSCELTVDLRMLTYTSIPLLLTSYNKSIVRSLEDVILWAILNNYEYPIMPLGLIKERSFRKPTVLQVLQQVSHAFLRTFSSTQCCCAYLNAFKIK